MNLLTDSRRLNVSDLYGCVDWFHVTLFCVQSDKDVSNFGKLISSIRKSGKVRLGGIAKFILNSLRNRSHKYLVPQTETDVYFLIFSVLRLTVCFVYILLMNLLYCHVFYM